MRQLPCGRFRSFVIWRDLGLSAYLGLLVGFVGVVVMVSPQLAQAPSLAELMAADNFVRIAGRLAATFVMAWSPCLFAIG